jgi:hypothetical protein
LFSNAYRQAASAVVIIEVVVERRIGAELAGPPPRRDRCPWLKSSNHSIDRRGNAPSCFVRLNRSSFAAAKTTPSWSKIAPESWECEIPKKLDRFLSVDFSVQVSFRTHNMTFRERRDAGTGGGNVAANRKLHNCRIQCE